MYMGYENVKDYCKPTEARVTNGPQTHEWLCIALNFQFCAIYAIECNLLSECNTVEFSSE